MVDITGAPVSVKPGMWDHIRNLDMNAIIQEIKTKDINWTEVGGLVVAGVIAGFIFKRYFKTFMMFIIGGALLIGLLDHFKISLIDWDYLQALLGVHPSQEAFQDLFQASFAWAKVNIKIVSSFGAGFFVGLKLS